MDKALADELTKLQRGIEAALTPPGKHLGPSTRKRRRGTQGSKAAGVIVSIALSGGSLFVSWRADSDQHNADTAASVAAHHQLADQVAFWVQTVPRSAGASISVQNRNSVPISDVTVRLGIPGPWKRPPLPGLEPEVGNVAPFSIGLVPPCTIATFAIPGNWTGAGSAAAFAAQFGPGHHPTYKMDLVFRDADGNSWDETGAGVLSPRATVPAQPAAVDPYVSMSPATGCS